MTPSKKRVIASYIGKVRDMPKRFTEKKIIDLTIK